MSDATPTKEGTMLAGFGRQATRAICAMTLTLVALGVATGVAHALSEWWTPAGARCPIFDSADACQAYCSADASRCGGSTECTFRTGPTRPMCAPSAKKPEPAGSGPDGWKGPAAN